MAAGDPLIFSKQNRLEKASQRAIEDRLEPWRLTWVDTRDDIGRDAFGQVTTEAGVGIVATKENFALQANATAKRFGPESTLSVETRHFDLWAEDSMPTLVAYWSSDSQELRIRTARELLPEVEIDSPGWRTQATVTLRFRERHAVPIGRSLENLRRQIVDEVDSLGGRTRFHKARRRVLIPQLFLNNMISSHTITLERNEGELTVHLGGGWRAAELALVDTEVSRVIIGALLLYEELWFPVRLVSSIVIALGEAVVQRLIDEGRIVFYSPPSLLGYVHPTGEVMGWLDQLTSMNPDQSPAGWNVGINAPHAAIAAKNLRLVEPAIIARTLEATNLDIDRADIREAMGMVARSSSKLPHWDRDLYNRLLHINLAHVVAEEYAVDVVDYEAGMSRIASLKLRGQLFARSHDTLQGLDEALAANSLPDIGLLVMSLGHAAAVQIACDLGAQDFRDWYWSSCAPAWNNSDEMARQFVRQAQSAFQLDARVAAFVEKVRFAYLKSSHGALSIVATPIIGARGISRRVATGKRTLEQQRLVQGKLRNERIRAHCGRNISAYEPCPCGSNEKFRFCCGLMS